MQLIRLSRNVIDFNKLDSLLIYLFRIFITTFYILFIYLTFLGIEFSFLGYI